MSSSNTYLVTGALGCIGTWVAHHLVGEGERTIGFDLGTSRHRLDLVLSPVEQQGLEIVRGDLSDSKAVARLFEDYPITHVIHLAALQVPFCRADPGLGAQVNVVGTVNLFEAVRRAGLKHFVYASSNAVYGPPDLYPPGSLTADSPLAPATLYGVYKQANEATARIYYQDHQIDSTGLRPNTVYGVGRDQGITSDPTKALLAAAADRAFEIQFSNRLQIQYASDVALQFIEASRSKLSGALVFNLGGEALNMEEVIAEIERLAPGSQISYRPLQLPFAAAADDTPLRRSFPRVYRTPFSQGAAETFESFRRHLAEGRIQEIP